MRSVLSQAKLNTAHVFCCACALQIKTNFSLWTSCSQFSTLLHHKDDYNHHELIRVSRDIMLTKLRRVKQWQTFARTWWVYDAKWQDPYDSGLLIARYLTGKHKPIWHPDTECGDHVVVINASQIALPNEEWKWRYFFHHTQFAGGMTWRSAWESHQQDPTFVLERAIYRFAGKKDARYKAFAMLTLLKGDEIPEDIKQRISGQIRQLRQVPQKLDEISKEELLDFPQLVTHKKFNY